MIGKRSFPHLEAKDEEVFLNAESGHAILEAARLDQLLQKLLLTYMPRMSNDLAENVFDNMGPLATFSAKILLARALGLIDGPIYSDLKAIKAIRNAFAHAEEALHFDSDHIIGKARSFVDWRDRAKAKNLFDNAVSRCVGAIKRKTDELVYAQATR